MESQSETVDARSENGVGTLDNWQRTDKPFYWFHCASLGEFEQGRPLIEALKNQGECQIVVTFFLLRDMKLEKIMPSPIW